MLDQSKQLGEAKLKAVVEDTGVKHCNTSHRFGRNIQSPSRFGASANVVSGWLLPSIDEARWGAVVGAPHAVVASVRRAEIVVGGEMFLTPPGFLITPKAFNLDPGEGCRGFLK